MTETNFLPIICGNCGKATPMIWLQNIEHAMICQECFERLPADQRFDRTPAQPIPKRVMTATVIDRILEIAREVQPDLWKRTEHVARIIAPEAFMDDWIVYPPERRALLQIKLKLLQGIAMRKANEVLAYLGVNTETDWITILERLAE